MFIFRVLMEIVENEARVIRLYYGIGIFGVVPIKLILLDIVEDYDSKGRAKWGLLYYILAPGYLKCLHIRIPRGGGTGCTHLSIRLYHLQKKIIGDTL